VTGHNALLFLFSSGLPFFFLILLDADAALGLLDRGQSSS